MERRSFLRVVLAAPVALCVESHVDGPVLTVDHARDMFAKFPPTRFQWAVMRPEFECKVRDDGD